MPPNPFWVRAFDMVKIIRSLRELDIAQLKNVYAESLNSGKDLLAAQQDFYGELMHFFKESAAYYAVLQSEGDYVAALRVEPYRDGLIVAGLETAPAHRRKGYAKKLLSAVVQQMPSGFMIYSHVDKKNDPSIAVHLACGFERKLEHAVFLDGSVSPNFCTFIKETPAQ